MNHSELLEALRDAGVPGRKYAVNGYRPEGSVNEGGGILGQGPDGRWSVYGWERGTASLVRSFDDEDQACRFFCDSLTRSVPEPVELTPEQRAELVARARRQQAERLREREEYFRRRDGDQADR